MSGEKINLYDLTLEDLNQFVRDLELPVYRAMQIWQWLYKDLATNFDQMSNLPQELREQLTLNVKLYFGELASLQQSADGQTTKVLFRLVDGNFIETVLMKYNKRTTVCVSTQAGCAMGCVFCATGQMGFTRNLSVAEIVGQVLYFARLEMAGGNRITNVVLMGMGEPLHNYSNSLATIDILTHQEGFNLGARKITISTVGLVPNIRRFADEQRQVTLAVSLHAATDEERDQLIPINKRWPLPDLMEACRYYTSKTGRRITFEWALISGENDSTVQAKSLGKLLKGMNCHVNLIPLNPTSGYKGKPSSQMQVSAFQSELERFGVSSSVRVRRGIDINAGCGQLRERFSEESSLLHQQSDL